MQWKLVENPKLSHTEHAISYASTAANTTPLKKLGIVGWFEAGFDKVFGGGGGFGKGEPQTKKETYDTLSDFNSFGGLVVLSKIRTNAFEQCLGHFRHFAPVETVRLRLQCSK